MKIRNFAFFGVMAAIFATANANADPNPAKRIASTNYVDGQVATRVEKNANIAAGTATKITYDAKGLVTAGGSLTAEDIPTITLSKISDNGTAAAADTTDTVTENGAGLPTAGAVYDYVNSQSSSAASGILTQSITDGDATHAPSGDAVNDALVNKVTKNNDITAGTATKITYDAKGLVTGGADITLSDVTDVTATAAEVNVLDGITATTTELNYVDGVTSSIQDQLDAKLPTATYTSEVGTVSAANMGTASGTVVGAINELSSAVSTLASDTTTYPEVDISGANALANIDGTASSAQDTNCTENDPCVLTYYYKDGAKQYRWSTIEGLPTE